MPNPHLESIVLVLTGDGGVWQFLLGQDLLWFTRIWQSCFLHREVHKPESVILASICQIHGKWKMELSIPLMKLKPFFKSWEWIIGSGTGNRALAAWTSDFLLPNYLLFVFHPGRRETEVRRDDGHDESRPLQKLQEQLAEGFASGARGQTQWQQTGWVWSLSVSNK